MNSGTRVPKIAFLSCEAILESDFQTAMKKKSEIDGQAGVRCLLGLKLKLLTLENEIKTVEKWVGEDSLAEYKGQTIRVVYC